jgi:uncharacterized membrane protein YgcG
MTMPVTMPVTVPETWRRIGRAAGAGLIAGLLGLATPTTAHADHHERAAELYFDELALNLSEPGLWIDPASVSKIPDSQVAELDLAAKNAPVQMRLAVIPAAVLVDAEQSSRPVTVRWEGPEVASKLYERVGVDGVYAILLDAPSSDDGRGFWAVQHSAGGPTYHVESGVDQAIECCAPVYGAMLERFVQRASQVDHPISVVALPVAGGIVAAFGLWWAGASMLARRRQHKEEEQHARTTYSLLNEEVIELSATVSALPTTADIEQARLTREALDAVEQARHRLDTLKTDTDIETVATLLGDARYLVHCLTALHQGEAPPERTSPCFFDPRHGPSTQQRRWAPELVWGSDGAEREISICDECADRLDAEAVPDARMVGEQYYWEVGEGLVAYIEGYWRASDQSWRFPDHRHYRAQDAMRVRRHNSRPAQQLAWGVRHAGLAVRNMAKEIAESSSRGGSGGSFGGGSAGSSSVSSSGGGRF